MGEALNSYGHKASDVEARSENILRAVNEFAHALINTHSWESVIEEALGKIGEAASASRAYVYQNDPRDSDLVGQRFEWAAPGTRSLIQDHSLSALSYSRLGFTRWFRSLSSGTAISGLVSQFPDSERVFLESRRVKSMVVVPVFANDIWWGFLGFNDYVQMRDWETTEISALRTAAECLGAAIARTKTESQFRELLERYRDFVEDTDSLVAQVDGIGRLRFANKAVRRILGDDIIGCFVFKYIKKEDQAPTGMTMQNAIATGSPHLNVEFTIHASDGESRTVQWTLNLHYQKGHVVSLNAIGRDVTETRRVEEAQRKLEENIRQMHKLESLGILAGGIAHDFNNLLTTILGNASLARIETQAGRSPLAMIKQMEQTALRASELTQQMLDYSGKGSFEVRPICLSEIAGDMTFLLESSISKKAELILEFPPDIPAIEADASQIRQVVMNLVLNASEALVEGKGVITVGTGFRHCDRHFLNRSIFSEYIAVGDYIYLRVKDTGLGISESNLKNIFDPFFTTKFTGRGLGLPVVLGIVRGHNGTIIVESQPNEGTEFVVLFPASDKPAVYIEDLVDEDGLQASGTILVIDDESSILEMATQILGSAGFRVITAMNGREGLSRFEENKQVIDAVLLDFTMPEMDGEETLLELRQQRPDLYVVLSSGYSEKHASRRFQDVKPDAFLQKPYRANELIRILSGFESSNSTKDA